MHKSNECIHLESSIPPLVGMSSVSCKNSESENVDWKWKWVEFKSPRIVPLSIVYRRPKEIVRHTQKIQKIQINNKWNRNPQSTGKILPIRINVGTRDEISESRRHVSNYFWIFLCYLHLSALFGCSKVKKNEKIHWFIEEVCRLAQRVAADSSICHEIQILQTRCSKIHTIFEAFWVRPSPGCYLPKDLHTGITHGSL